MPTQRLKIDDEELLITTQELPIIAKVVRKNRRPRWWHRLLWWRRPPRSYIYHQPLPLLSQGNAAEELYRTASPRYRAIGHSLRRQLDPETDAIRIANVEQHQRGIRL